MLESKYLASLSLSLFTLLYVNSVHAFTLKLTPATQDVLLSNQVDVELSISDLGNSSAPSLGAYDLDILFDDSLLSFDSASFGDPVKGNQLDLFGFGFNPAGASPMNGKINLFEISFDFPSVLDSFQSDNFTLATLRFNTLQTGSSSLSIAPIHFGDSLGNSITHTSLQNTTVNITSQSEPVPEPSQLLGAALAIGFGLWFKRSQVRKGFKSNK